MGEASRVPALHTDDLGLFTLLGVNLARKARRVLAPHEETALAVLGAQEGAQEQHVVARVDLVRRPPLYVVLAQHLGAGVVWAWHTGCIADLEGARYRAREAGLAYSGGVRTLCCRRPFGEGEVSVKGQTADLAFRRWCRLGGCGTRGGGGYRFLVLGWRVSFPQFLCL